MTSHLARGILLYQQDRHAQAERELGLAVAEDPDDPTPAAYLALCLAEQGKLDPAEDAAGAAVRAGPNDPFAHLARAQVLYKRGRPAEAEPAALESLRLDPSNPSAYAILAAVRFDRGNWPGALAAADGGLAHDPTHPGCANARTVALLQLGRKREASESAAAALTTAPDDSSAHTARGWALLHEGNPGEALVHFREALRLDPTSAWARDGMIAALKARYWAYRQMLRFFLWMGRKRRSTQWLVLIGLLVGQQFLVRVGEANPALEPFVMPVFWVLIGFVFLTWLADPLFNLLLRLNKFGRHALTQDQRRQSHWVGGGVIVVLIAAAVWVFGPDAEVRRGRDVIRVIGKTTAFTTLFILPPVSSVFRVSVGWPRRVLTAYAMGMALVGVLMVVNFVGAVNADHEWEFTSRVRGAWQLFNTNMWACLLSGVLINVLHRVPRRRRR